MISLKGSYKSIEVGELARELTKTDAFRQSGKVARTVARGDRRTLVLSVLKEGVEIHEHGAPGPVVVAVMTGSVILRSEHQGRSTTTLNGGSVALFSGEVRHSLKGNEDSVFLVIIGGRREA